MSKIIYSIEYTPERDIFHILEHNSMGDRRLVAVCKTKQEAKTTICKLINQLKMRDQ